MAGMVEAIKAAKAESLHLVVENGRQKFLCFTRLSDTWTICVTDCTDMWRLDLDDEELDAYRDLAGLNTIDVFLTRFRNGFSSNNVSVAMIGNKVSLTVGKGTDALTFDLFEAKAAEKKSQLQHVLFRLSESATVLESKLTAAERTIENLRAQKGAGMGALMDLGPKKGANQALNKPKKAGMSAINPTSKKRKAAHGVVFD